MSEPTHRDKRQHLIWSASPTPFLSNGNLDEPSLDRLVEQHLRLGVGGLFLCGTCGEGPFMPDRQRRQLVERMRVLAGDRLYLSVQVSDTSAARVIENMKHMTDAGADALVIAPPLAVAGLCSRDFLRRYFLEPLEQAALPVGIYIRPSGPTVPLDLALWDEVIAHPRVKLVKDSSGSMDYVRHFVTTKTKRPELICLTGDEFNAVASVAEGYDGCLMGTAILNARLIGRGLDQLAAGNRAEAQAWQDRSNAFLWDLFRRDASAWMAGLKYALRQRGIFSTEFSHLVFPLTDDDRRRIDAALERERQFIG